MTGATLTFYGGVDEIGGNKFLLEDRGSRIFLDFGLSFAGHGKFFTEFLQARKFNALGDYFALGLLPKVSGVYRTDYLEHMGAAKEERGIDAVVISHAHVDHIGDLHFLREDVPILASRASFATMEALEATGKSPFQEYLHLRPSFQTGSKREGGQKRLTKRDVGDIERPQNPYGEKPVYVGEIEVRGVPEDHSLPGAAGVLVETPTLRLAYTGDFRFHGRHGAKSRAFVEGAASFDPDLLLVEGTRVRALEQDSEADVAREIERVLRETAGLVLANWPIRDTDRLLSFYEASRNAGRELCISMKQAHLLETLRTAGEEELPRLDDTSIRIYVPREGWGQFGRPGISRKLGLQDYREPWKKRYAEHPRAIMAREVRDDPARYVVRMDFFELHELVDLSPGPGSIYFRSTTEPFNLELELDEAIAKAWLAQFGIPYVHKHASGHASGPELWDAIRRIRPRAVVPIHTVDHELFVKNLEPGGIEVRRPQNVLRPGGHPMEL